MLQLITDANNTMWNVANTESFYIKSVNHRYYIMANLVQPKPPIELYGSKKEGIAKEVFQNIDDAVLDGKSAVDVRVLEGQVRDEHPDLFE